MFIVRQISLCFYSNFDQESLLDAEFENTNKKSNFFLWQICQFNHYGWLILLELYWFLNSNWQKLIIGAFSYKAHFRHQISSNVICIFLFIGKSTCLVKALKLTLSSNVLAISTYSHERDRLGTIFMQLLLCFITLYLLSKKYCCNILIEGFPHDMDVFPTIDISFIHDDHILLLLFRLVY